MNTFFVLTVAVVASQTLALPIQDETDACADCNAFFTDRQEMTLENIDREEAKMNRRCSSLEPSKVEECKRKVEEIYQKKKDNANRQSPKTICEAIKFCKSLDTEKINQPISKAEGKRRCKDCKNFLKDVKEKEMVIATTVGELIESTFCGKLGEDRQEKCEGFVENAIEKEIELLDLVNVENTCKLLDMCGGN